MTKVYTSRHHRKGTLSRRNVPTRGMPVGVESPTEVAATVVVKLIEIAGRRAECIPDLSAAVRRAVDELDPEGVRDSSPTWWQDLPPGQYLDPFDRVRRAHDQLLVLEVQANDVVQDLRGFLSLTPAGGPGRPFGYSPARAHAVLERMALRRAEMLSDMGRAVRMLQPQLSKETAAALRSGIRAVADEESRAQVERVRLTELLSA